MKDDKFRWSGIRRVSDDCKGSDRALSWSDLIDRVPTGDAVAALRLAYPQVFVGGVEEAGEEDEEEPLQLAHASALPYSCPIYGRFWLVSSEGAILEDGGAFDTGDVITSLAQAVRLAYRKIFVDGVAGDIFIYDDRANEVVEIVKGSR